MIDVNALLEEAGVDTSGMSRGSSASANLSMYQDLINFAGNPVFLLQQGLVTPEEFQQTMRMYASEPVTLEDLEDFDFQPLLDIAGGGNEPELAIAYDMITKGYSVDQALRTLKESSIEVLGKTVSATNDLDPELFRGDLEEFKRRYDNAMSLQSGLLTGEYFESGGQLFKKMSTEDARKVYASVGLPDYLQNPLLYETMPDPEIIARAVAGEKEAVDLTKRLNAASRTAGKAATKTAQGVYQDIISQAKAGEKKGVQTVTGLEDRETYEQSAFRPTAQSRAMASPPVTGGRPATAPKPAAGQAAAKPLAQWIANKYREVQQGANTNEAILARLSPAAREQVAKAAQSYAGRSQMEQDPVLSDLRKQLERKNAMVESLKKEAVAKGTIPGVQLLQQAMPVAAALSTPQPKAARRGPRVLSDQEIETMASMIAGGTL